MPQIPDLPFSYLGLLDVLAVGPNKSKSRLYAAIRAGTAPEPDIVNGRALWRSDVIAKWLLDTAAKADAGREAARAKAKAKARRRTSAVLRDAASATPEQRQTRAARTRESKAAGIAHRMAAARRMVVS